MLSGSDFNDGASHSESNQPNIHMAQTLLLSNPHEIKQTVQIVAS